MNNKIKTVNKLFEGKNIRSVWSKEIEDYYFSVVDVIYALTDSNNPRDYWYRLKKRMSDEEKSELSTKCRQLKLQSSDGKYYNTDVLDTEGIFRLIQSVPSKKAEPFKLWLAKLGREEVDNMFDPSKGVDRMIDYYLLKGYSISWIEDRIKAIINRKKLTSTWSENGISKSSDYAILTNEIYKTWSGMSVKEYKEYKGLGKENLRDNMTDIEILLTDLGEITTRDIVKNEHPSNIRENIKIAKRGGNVSKMAREHYEKETGNNVVTSENFIISIKTNKKR